MHIFFSRILFSMLYSKSFSFICFIYKGLYVSDNPELLIYVLPTFPFGNHSLFPMSVSLVLFCESEIHSVMSDSL